MGRGRSKAKQTKIARDLKYFTPPTDLHALQRELAATSPSVDGRAEPAEQSDADDEGRQA